MRSLSARAVGALVVALATLAAGQGAVASNTTTFVQTDPGGDPNNINQAVLAIFVSGIAQGQAYLLDPLTQEAYDYLPHDSKTTDNKNGSLVLSTPGQKYSDSAPDSTDFALASCDEADYTGELGMTDVVQTAIDAQVQAIIFYSRVLPYCNITNISSYDNYAYLYTLTHTNDSNWLFNNLTGFYHINEAQLFSLTAFNNAESGGGGGTAIAMIILYSITGVITALFLIIIVTGAVRAHRHPERYGPRSVLGRARQSRAKGIARAMLETIPIVKFGEHTEPPKDVEGRSTSASHELQDRPREGAAAGTDGISVAGVTSVTQLTKSSTAEGAEGAAASSSAAEHTHPKPTEEEAQGCSICTDDFERGQDIRVLPCGHQYHPACVDPWLLDVSGTCPLCRVDLHPANDAETGDLPPPLNPESSDAAAGARGPRDAIRNFFNRGTDLSRATRDERLQALRSWRRANRSAAPERATATTAMATTTTDEAEAEPNSSPDAQTGAGRLGRLSRLVRRR